MYFLYSFIKQYNDDSGESGSFFSFLAEKFKSKASLLAFLKRVRGSIDDASLLEAIEGMISSLEDSPQKEENQEEGTDKYIVQKDTEDYPLQFSKLRAKNSTFIEDIPYKKKYKNIHQAKSKS